MSTLDTRIHLSPSFPRVPQEPLLSVWTPGHHSGSATHTKLLKERLHEAGAIAQGCRVDVHVIRVLPWEQGKQAVSPGAGRVAGVSTGTRPPHKHHPKDIGQPTPPCLALEQAPREWRSPQGHCCSPPGGQEGGKAVKPQVQDLPGLPAETPALSRTGGRKTSAKRRFRREQPPAATAGLTPAPMPRARRSWEVERVGSKAPRGG